MKSFRLYTFLALLIVISLAAVSGCSTVTIPEETPAAPAVPATQPVITAPVTAPVAGTSDLVITKVWLDGLTINYTIKNVGTVDSPQTYCHIYVDDIMPAQGGSSFVPILKPGQEELLDFSNYQWPFGKSFNEVSARVRSEGYIELPLNNNKVKVCADAQNEATEMVETNNCKVTLIGILWDYDLLRVANVATWRNGDGDLPEPGSEKSVNGAHFPVANSDMEMTPQLEMIPQQVPQGWVQGTWGYFYSDEYGSPETAAIKFPAKLHFVARVGLASNATGSDGVTFKVGLKDLNDTVTWIDSKKVTTPGAFENWDINLSNYEGQKYCFVLRVEAGASPVKDFAIWNQARVLQVND